jgi:hypothetical protein
VNQHHGRALLDRRRPLRHSRVDDCPRAATDLTADRGQDRGVDSTGR